MDSNLHQLLFKTCKPQQTILAVGDFLHTANLEALPPKAHSSLLRESGQRD